MLDRLWSKIDVSGGPNACWPFTAPVGGPGYGAIRIGGRAGKDHYAHRLSWEHHNGPIPAGLCVLHRCDNRRCCNPAHLFLGTKGDNIRDCRDKGRMGGWFPKGHIRSRGENSALAVLTEEQVRNIRRAVMSGLSRGATAKRFGVCRQHVGDIMSGRRWKHVI